MGDWGGEIQHGPGWEAGHLAGWREGYEAGQRDKLQPDIVDKAIVERVTELLGSLRVLRERAG